MKSRDTLVRGAFFMSTTEIPWKLTKRQRRRWKRYGIVPPGFRIFEQQLATRDMDRIPPGTSCRATNPIERMWERVSFKDLI